MIYYREIEFYSHPFFCNNNKIHATQHNSMRWCARVLLCDGMKKKEYFQYHKEQYRSSVRFLIQYMIVKYRRKREEGKKFFNLPPYNILH